MSEFIVNVNGQVPDAFYERFAGEIVRCRDCRHYVDHEWIIATDVSDVCHFWHGKPTKVAPDGFCAWGIRREA